MSGAHSTSHVNALRHFPEQGVVAWDGSKYAPMLPRGVREFVVDPVNGDDDHAKAGKGDWATIQGCIDNAVVSGRGDRVLVLPKATLSGTFDGSTIHPFDESVVLTKDNVALIGVCANPLWSYMVWWRPAVSGETCLEITGSCCTVTGFNFRAVGGGMCIHNNCQAVVRAKCTNIIRNRFSMEGVGIGIAGGDNVVILENFFEYLVWAIKQEYSGFQHPQRIRIIGNIIQNCTNGIQLDSCLGLFKDNILDGIGTINLDTKKASGAKNIVIGNFFGGDYSIAGGYQAAADDLSWFGNTSPDTAEAEVDAAGRTIGVPV